MSPADPSTDNTAGETREKVALVTGSAKRVGASLVRALHTKGFRIIIHYRSVSKVKSTYTDRLPLQIAESTVRVHTSYHQAVAATGRLSSTDPNLQNIPIRTPEGRRIRQAFVAPDGQVLMAADYSQIELRIMAHLSADAGLLKAFTDDRDVHQATAA